MPKPTAVKKTLGPQGLVKAWSDSALDEFAQRLSTVVISDSLYERYKLERGHYDEECIQSWLLTCASSAFVRQPGAMPSRKSRDQVSGALAKLLGILERQRKLRIDDPSREGLELFVLHSQHGEEPADLVSWPARRDFGPQHAPVPALLPSDRFSSVGSAWTIGNEQGWLERLLSEINKKMEARPASRRGPKGKKCVRDYFIWNMARFFETRGGIVKVYKNSVSGKIEGRFISFLNEILDPCPEPLHSYLSVGMPDAVFEWFDQGRPE